MKNDPHTHGLWEKTAPPAPQTSPLTQNLTTDVIIIGGGYTGLSAALTLTTSGRSCVVLEAEEIGFGGSGRNVGLVNAGLWLQPKDVLSTLGLDYGSRILTLLDSAPATVFNLIEQHGIACEASRAGTLHCASDASGIRQLKARTRQWQALGADVTFLNRNEARALTGSPIYHGALLDRRAGTIQPLAYARGLARAAQTAGAQIHTGTRVTGAERSPGGWTVRTANGTVTAPHVIVATNAYTVAPWKPIQSELVALPYFNIATAPLPQALRATVLPQNHGLWDTKEILTSIRMDQANRLIIGSVGALRYGAEPIHASWARRSMLKLFPQLSDIPFQHAWWGTIGMTSDCVPRFHQLDTNVITICGYNGRGIGPGTVFGQALAECVMNKRSLADMPLPLLPLQADKLKPAKEIFYEAGATAAHLVTDRF